MEQNIEQRAAAARNSDNLMQALVVLEALAAHGMSPRQYRELAEPLVQKLHSGLYPVFEARPDLRLEGGLIDLLVLPEEEAKRKAKKKAKKKAAAKKKAT